MKWPLDFKDKIICGDNLEIMRQIPDGKIDMGMTSPPYWGLRDYEVKGQCGLEDTPEKYIDKMVIIFHELKRILKPSGSFFLNMGDTYSSDSHIRQTSKDRYYKNKDEKRYRDTLASERHAGRSDKKRRSFKNMHVPKKSLCMIPERLAWALIEDGWILRNKIIWYKPQGMPSPVKDRLTNKWEYVFLFSKSGNYYFDLDGIREKPIWGGENWGDVGKKLKKAKLVSDHKFENHPLGKNPGDVFIIPTQPFPEAHFAVFPEKLCEKPIQAGCPPSGIIIDPFVGTGTTVYVANKLMRHGIGIDLNPKFCEMARRRISQKNLFVHNRPLQETTNAAGTMEGTDVAQQQLGNIIIHEIDKQIMED